MGPIEDLVCPRCGAAFDSRSDLESHVSSHVTGNPGDKHVCLVCGASFGSRTELDAHAQKHEAGREAA